MSCRIGSAGYYFVSIFAGRYGRSSIRMKTIKEQDSFTGAVNLFERAPEPSNLSADVIDNKLYLLWNSTAAITELKISQEGLHQTYTLSNYHTRFQVPLADFTNFKESNTVVEIRHANSRDGTYYSISSPLSAEKNTSFFALKHGFDEIAEELIEI